MSHSSATLAIASQKTTCMPAGRSPLRLSSVRGWTYAVERRTIAKLIGVKTPAVIAKTEAARAWRSGSSIAKRIGW